MTHKVEIHLGRIAHGDGSYVRIDGRDIDACDVKITAGVRQTTDVRLTLPACEVLFTADEAEVHAFRTVPAK